MEEEKLQMIIGIYGMNNILLEMNILTISVISLIIHKKQNISYISYAVTLRGITVNL